MSIMRLLKMEFITCFKIYCFLTRNTRLYTLCSRSWLCDHRASLFQSEDRKPTLGTRAGSQTGRKARTTQLVRPGTQGPRASGAKFCFHSLAMGTVDGPVTSPLA